MKKLLLVALVLALFLYGAMTTQAALVNLNWIYDTVENTLQPAKNAINARIMGSFFTGTSTTESSTFAILNEVRYVDEFPGADAGAKAMAAYSSAPDDVTLVFTASSTYTSMVFDTIGKHVKLECAPGVVLTYTGSASSTVFATFVYPDYPTDAGVDGCIFDGPSGSSVVAWSLGNSTAGAAGYKFRNFTIQDFGVGIVSGANTYLTSFDNFVLQNNNRALTVYAANNSGENLRYSNGLIGDCKTIADCAYFATSSSASTLWEGMSLDNAQLKIATGNFNFNVIGGHCENPAAQDAVIGKYACIVNNGETTGFNGLSVVNMATSSAQTPDCFIVNTGYLNIFSASVWAANSISAPAFVCNSSTATANVYGFNELGSSIDTIATSSTGLFIADNRNVGVGTSSPAGLFDVNGSAFFGNQTGTAQLTLRAGSGRNGTIGQEGTSATSALAFNSNGSIDFRTDGTSKMYVTDQGLVGIGTITPTSPLHVSGQAGNTALFYNNTGATRVIVRGNSNSNFGFSDPVLSVRNTANTQTAAIREDGLIGSSQIGTLDDTTATLVDSSVATGFLRRGLNLGNSGLIAWGSPNWWSSKDLSLTRISTGTLALGTGAASSTDGRLVLGTLAASGTSTLATSTITSLSIGSDTGLLKSTSGLVSTAVAGTDYLNVIATTTVRGMFSSSATGLTYNSTTGDFSLTAGSVIPLTASTTAWEAFYQTPSTRITAGTGLSWSGNTLNASGGGTGDVVGPASATDNAIARFDTTTGKLIQNSSTTISDTGSISTGNATGDQSISINSGSTRIGSITQVGSAANSPLRITSNGALDLQVDTISRINIGEFGDVTIGATTTAPTTTISRLNIGSLTGLLKGTSGLVSVATPGTDYVANATGDWTGTFDGQEGSYYLNAGNLTGTLASARLSGAYTGITGLGTLTELTVVGTSTFATTTAASSTIGTLNLTNALTAGMGGTGFNSYATGDMIYASGVNTLAKRTIGSLGNVLSVVGGVPTWVSTSSLNIAGGGGGGSGTVNSGTTGQMARYDSAGTAVTGTSTVLVADNGTVFIGSPSISPNIVSVMEQNVPTGYSTVAVRNTAADGRSQVTFSNGLGSNYYDCFVGSSGSSTANYPNTMEVGCGFAGSGINFWSDGFLQARMATSGNMGFGTTTNLLSKLSVQTDNTNSGSSLFTAYNSTGAPVAIITNGGTFNSNGGYRTPFSGVGYAVTSGTATTSSIIADFFAGGSQAVVRGYEGNGIGLFTGSGTPVERLRVTQDGRVAIGTTTATGTLAVQSPSLGQTVAQFFSNMGSTTMAVLTATSTVQHASALAGFAQDSLARVVIGINPLVGYYRSGKLFGALTVSGPIYQEGWDQVDCSQLVGATAIAADGLTGCDGFAFYEDGTETLTATTEGGNVFARLSTSLTNGGAGVFVNAPSTGAYIFATSTPKLEITARMHTMQNWGTSTRAYIGFTNIASAGTAYEIEPTIGCYFTASSSLANWQAVCRTSAAAQTVVDTGVASTTAAGTGNGRPYRFFIEADSVEAKFFIQSSEAGNLTQVAGITTTYPSTNALNAGAHFGGPTGVAARGIDIYDMNFAWRKVLR
jgi:hypothetical protein